MEYGAGASRRCDRLTRIRSKLPRHSPHPQVEAGGVPRYSRLASQRGAVWGTWGTGEFRQD
jgi:hypothetical protein